MASDEDVKGLQYSSSVTSRQEEEQRKEEQEEEEEEKSVWRESFEWEIEYPVQQVWEVTRDFTNMHKWVPSFLRSCRLVEGEAEEAGCVRLVETQGTPSGHALEKLVELDPVAHKFSYVVLDSSAPFLVGLSPTFHLLEASPSSTLLIWSYEVAPVPGLDQMFLRQFVLSNLYQSCIHDLKMTLARTLL